MLNHLLDEYCNQFKIPIDENNEYSQNNEPINDDDNINSIIIHDTVFIINFNNNKHELHYKTPNTWCLIIEKKKSFIYDEKKIYKTIELYNDNDNNENNKINYVINWYIEINNNEIIICEIQKIIIKKLKILIKTNNIKHFDDYYQNIKFDYDKCVKSIEEKKNNDFINDCNIINYEINSYHDEFFINEILKMTNQNVHIICKFINCIAWPEKIDTGIKDWFAFLK